MNEIAFQITRAGIKPFSVEDMEKLKEYKPNQVLRAKVTGAKKQRSYEQLKLFWAGCKIVAENTDHPYWSTKEKVAEQVKQAVKFFDYEKIIVTPNGDVVIPTRSISYENLGHMEACRFFDQAFEIMSEFIGVDIKTFTNEVRNVA